MSLLDNFPHEATIRRRLRTADDLGGTIDTPAGTTTGVVCWEQAASDREVLEFEKRGMQIDRKVYFRTDPNLTTRHQILITKRLGVVVANPDVLDVKSAAGPDATAGLGIVFRVMCQLLTSEKT